jgi:predicted phosphodiesterase
MRFSDDNIRTAIAILKRTPVDCFREAMVEIERATGVHVGKSTLAHAFQRRGLQSPSSYCLPKRGADRFDVPRVAEPASRPAPATPVGDTARPGGVGRGGESASRGGVDARATRFDALIKLTRHPMRFTELCDRLDLSPRRCQALIDEARAAGLYVDVNHEHVGMRVPEPDMAATPQIGPAPVVGGRHTIAVSSDWHFGSRYCMRSHLRETIHMAYEAGARQILCAGDILDGAHPDRIHELSHYGMDEQTDDAFETLPQLPGLTYHAITGNHDSWYTRARGVNIGEFIEARFRRRGRTDLHIYGPARKTLLVGSIKVELWHPGKWKGNAYAGSYKLERHIDTAYEAGSKPQILVVGHLHRYIKIRRRGIHALLAPCFQAPESEFSKELGGAVANGGLILSWELTADNTIRRFACEEIDYFVREMPEPLRDVA